MKYILDYLLKRLLWNKIKLIKNDYNRFLEYGDYFIDRWEKAKYLGFGDGTSVYNSCLVLGNVQVGRNCWIGPYTILDGSNGILTIGDNTNISAGVHIYTHDTVDQVIYNQEESNCGDVRIGNNVYIGPNSVISKNLNIGSFVVIGANSFVNKSIPSMKKGFGTPFRVIEDIEIEN